MIKAVKAEPKIRISARVYIMTFKIGKKLS